MSEMIERIARRIEPLAWAALGVMDTDIHDSRRRLSILKAGSVLQAIREPTEEMAMVKSDPQEATMYWRAMIDEALKP